MVSDLVEGLFKVIHRAVNFDKCKETTLNRILVWLSLCFIWPLLLGDS